MKQKRYILKQSSYKELAKTIINSPVIQEDIQKIIKNRHDYNYESNPSLILEARAFCYHTMRVTEDIYLFSTNIPLSSYSAPFSKLTPKTQIFQYMDLKTIKKLVLPYVFNTEKAKRINAKFNATAKVLKADHFSYTLFETYLNELKKPLSGEDALRYTKQVMKLPDEFNTLYTKLLWKYVNRTQKIIKEFRTVFGSDHENLLL